MAAKHEEANCPELPDLKWILNLSIYDKAQLQYFVVFCKMQNDSFYDF